MPTAIKTQDNKVAKHPGGRPTKYTPELLALAWDYVESYSEKYSDPVPSVVGLTETLDITEETAYKWVKERNKKEFSEIMQRIKSAQHRCLVSGGLTGKHNSVIAKLMLSKHGYSDNNSQQDQGLSITVDRACGRTTISKGRDTVTINDGKTIEASDQADTAK